MANGKIKQVEGQMSFEDFCTDLSNYVVQSNELVCGCQSLKLNSKKLVCSAIMQIKKNDDEFKPYIVSITELAEMFGISRDNLYRDIDSITDDIIKNPLKIKSGEIGNQKWVKIPWVSLCAYDENRGVFIQLNEQLKPLLLHLEGNYLQYISEETMHMKSPYSIRIFEIVMSHVYNKQIPKSGVHVVISVETLREGCDCMDKHKEFSNFNMRVLEPAVKEINKQTYKNMTYTYKKKGRRVEYIDFLVKSI